MEEVKFELSHDENLNEIKMNALKKIKASILCKKFIKENNLSDEVIVKNASKFLRYIDSIETPDTIKQLKGVHLELSYDEENMIVDVIYVNNKENEYIAKMNAKYIVREFPEDYFKYKLNDTLDPDYKASRAKALKVLVAVIKEKSSKGLYLYGSRRCGKSFILAVFSKVALENGYNTAAFINTTKEFKYINDLNYTDKQEFDRYLKALGEVDILVLDDFGNEYKNEFVRDSILFPLLNARADNNKVTCFTSAYTVDEIKSMYSLREKDSPKGRQLAELITYLAKAEEINSLPYRK